jgi:hypothetical protein
MSDIKKIKQGSNEQGQKQERKEYGNQGQNERGQRRDEQDRNKNNRGNEYGKDSNKDYEDTDSGSNNYRNQ